MNELYVLCSLVTTEIIDYLTWLLSMIWRFWIQEISMIWCFRILEIFHGQQIEAHQRPCGTRTNFAGMCRGRGGRSMQRYVLTEKCRVRFSA